jgi:hypothetical protein
MLRRIAAASVRRPSVMTKFGLVSPTPCLKAMCSLPTVSLQLNYSDGMPKPAANDKKPYYMGALHW